MIIIIIIKMIMTPTRLFFNILPILATKKKTVTVTHYWPFVRIPSPGDGDDDGDDEEDEDRVGVKQ